MNDSSLPRDGPTTERLPSVDWPNPNREKWLTEEWTKFCQGATKEQLGFDDLKMLSDEDLAMLGANTLGKRLSL